MSSPEPREMPSPLTLDKDFGRTVTKDFSIRSLGADDLLEPEDVAVPKALTSSATDSVTSQNPEDSDADLIPEPEDLSAPVEEGPQLPIENTSLQPSSEETNPGDATPPVATPIPKSSSPVVVK